MTTPPDHKGSASLSHPLALAITGMLAMTAAMGIGRFVYTPILPIMVEDLGLDAFRAGMIASSNYLGYLAGALLAATSWMGGSPRNWLAGSLLASGITTLAMGFADSYAGFLLVRFVGGLVSAWVLVYASNLVIERLISGGRGDLTALHFGGVGLGIAASALLTAFAGSEGEAWRVAWWASGTVAVILAVVVVPTIPRSTVGAPGSGHQPENGHSSPYRGLCGLLWSYGLYGFGYVITATFLVQLVRASPYGSDIETLVWLVVGLAGAPSIWIWNRIANRIGHTLTYALACLVEAVGVAASVVSASLLSLLVASVLFGGTFMAIAAIGLVEARQRSSRDPRASLAMMTAAFGLGQIIGPAVAGYLGDITGNFVLPTGLAVLALVLAAGSAFYRRSGLTDPPARNITG